MKTSDLGLVNMQVEDELWSLVYEEMWLMTDSLETATFKGQIDKKKPKKEAEKE